MFPLHQKLHHDGLHRVAPRRRETHSHIKNAIIIIIKEILLFIRFVSKYLAGSHLSKSPNCPEVQTPLRLLRLGTSPCHHFQGFESYTVKIDSKWSSEEYFSGIFKLKFNYLRNFEDVFDRTNFNISKSCFYRGLVEVAHVSAQRTIRTRSFMQLQAI